MGKVIMLNSEARSRISLELHLGVRHSVTSYTKGEEALKEIDIIKPNVIITKYQLLGITGWDFARLLRDYGKYKLKFPLVCSPVAKDLLILAEA